MAQARKARKFNSFSAGFFKYCAAKVFDKWKPRVIMVTGSSGKSTMVNLIENQLGDKGYYARHIHSAIDICLNILGMEDEITKNPRSSTLNLAFAALSKAFDKKYARHEPYYIVTTEAWAPGEVEFVAKWLKPEITMWISCDDDHADAFEDMVLKGKAPSVYDAIAHEYSTCVANTQQLSFINGDNELLTKAARATGHSTVPYSLKAVQGYEVRAGKSVVHFGDRMYVFDDPVPYTIAIQLQMLEGLMEYLHLELNPYLPGFKLPPSRSSLLRGKKGLKLIDCSAAVSFSGAAASITMFKAMKAMSKWAIVGDLLNTGRQEGEDHQKLAKILLSSGVQHVILLGPRMRQFAYPVLNAKIDVQVFTQAQEVVDYLTEHTTAADTAMFCGDFAIDWVVIQMLENPNDDVKVSRRTIV